MKTHASWTLATGLSPLLLGALAAPSLAQLGSEWSRVDLRTFGAREIATSPVDPDTVVLASARRVAVTTDGGQTFAPTPFEASDGISDVAFAVDGRLLIADGDTVKVSLDDGLSFVSEIVVDAPGVDVTSIATDPADPLRAWAGLSGGAQLAITTDGGASWSPATPPGFQFGCGAIAIDPTDGDRVLACQTSTRVFLTDDGGANWTAVTPSSSFNVRVTQCIYAGPRIVLAGAWRVLTSDDDGATFSVAQGTPGPTSGLITPWARDLVALDPAAQHLLVTLETAGLRESVDGGLTWTPAGPPIVSTTNFGLGLEPRPGGVLWFGTVVGGTFSFDPATGSVAPVAPDTFGAEPLGERRAILRVAFDPAAPDRMAVIADAPASIAPRLANGVLFVTDDGGAHWSVQPDATGAVASVAIGPDGALWAGTRDEFGVLGGGETLLVERGAGWTETGPPFVSGAEGGTLGVAIAPDDPDFVVAVDVETPLQLDRTAVWISTDGGNAWTLSDEVFGAFSAPFNTIWREPDPVVFGGGVGGPRIAYRRHVIDFGQISGFRTQLHVSNNGGASWRTPTDTEITGDQLIDFGAAGDTLYRAVEEPQNSTRPIEVSDDGGFTWTGSGVPARAFDRVAVSPNERGVLFGAAAAEGIVRITGSGADTEALDLPLSGFVAFSGISAGGADGVAVLVRAASGAFMKRIPLELGDRSCAPPTENSAGLDGQVRLEGSDSILVNDVSIVARRLPAGTTVLPIFGDVAIAPTVLVGTVGTLCVGGAIGRFIDEVGAADPGGSYSARIDLTDLPAPTGAVSAVAGDRFQFQCWYRDVQGATQTSNFTDAVAVTFLP